MDPRAAHTRDRHTVAVAHGVVFRLRFPETVIRFSFRPDCPHPVGPA
ncbi:MAG: hypothetical protein FD153_921 [Rhodospirillaceae bacterium]|nr:MAG: hypothetical protein FD153_921 [Rhodospirillaceae bacterium]